MKNRKLMGIIMVTLLVVLAACASQAAENANLGSEDDVQNINQGLPAGGGSDDSEAGTEVEFEGDVIGITWQWVRFEDATGLNDIVVGDPTQFTLVLNADGSYNAKVDCNWAGGNYTLQGSSITFEPGEMTEALCPPDSLDSTFLAHLFNVEEFVIDGENLVLNLPADDGKMVFAPAVEETESLEITDITWLWVRFDDTAGLNNIEVAETTFYTLVLNADGSYNAKVDCNQVMGSYTLEDGSITFEPGITTLAECGPESLYNIFLAHLSNVATFVMDGEHLVLNLWADGGNMVFAPAE